MFLLSSVVEARNSENAAANLKMQFKAIKIKIKVTHKIQDGNKSTVCKHWYFTIGCVISTGEDFVW